VPTQVDFPKAMFLANFDIGKIDVISLNSGLKIVEPIAAPSVSALCNYWRE
jgi:hypothetical protein